jgi:thiosulfate dehydrogenase [quinone] large subunit
MTNVNTQLLGRDVTFTISDSWLAYWLVMMRFAVGWWFLHAGLDKFLAWPFDASWFVGGAAAATSLGPVLTLFSEGAALTLVNVMVPVGQTLIGLGVILGALTRLASFFGAFLMLFFYFVNGETGGWSHGLITGELLGLLLFAMIATLGAGRVLGVDAYLAKLDVFRNTRLRYIIG